MTQKFHHPTKICATGNQKTGIRMFMAELFVKYLGQKEPTYPKELNKLCIFHILSTTHSVPYNGKLHSYENKLLLNENVDESSKYNVEKKKPSTNDNAIIRYKNAYNSANILKTTEILQMGEFYCM